ncbi:Nuclear transcription factor Y subunit C-1 [Capsicum annuum]|nr:Nuclear transcription factor Y subunit C-1 [Capsicum annuum]
MENTNPHQSAPEANAAATEAKAAAKADLMAEDAAAEAELTAVEVNAVPKEDLMAEDFAVEVEFTSEDLEAAAAAQAAADAMVEMNAAAVAAAAVGGYPYNHQLAQKQQLEMFWHFKRHEIEHSTNLRNHQLPLARIRKIAKDTPNVKKISAEVPILFSKACELFIQEFTLRSWFHADENNRYSIQGNDVAAAIRRTDHFDFLAHVPTDEIMGEATAAATVTGVVGSTSSGVPDYNPPMGQPGPSEVTMGRASVPLVHPSAYFQPQSWQPTPSLPQVWQPQPPQSQAWPSSSSALQPQPLLQWWQPPPPQFQAWQLPPSFSQAWQPQPPQSLAWPSSSAAWQPQPLPSPSSSQGWQLPPPQSQAWQLLPSSSQAWQLQPSSSQAWQLQPSSSQEGQPQPPPSQECQWVWQPVEDNPDNPSGDGGYVIACQLEVGFDMQMIYASTDDTNTYEEEYLEFLQKIELNWTHCAVLSLFGKLSEPQDQAMVTMVNVLWVRHAEPVQFSIVDGDASFISALSQDRMVMIIRSGLLMMVLMACRAIVLISRKPFKVYDMVEALGDYTEMKGVTVAPLVKVPSYFLRGREAPNAPTGCWELDLAVLPMELLEVIIDA